MKKLSIISKKCLIILSLCIWSFLGIQVKAIGQAIDFNSTADGLAACESGNFTTTFTILNLNAIPAVACATHTITSIQLQVLVDGASTLCPGGGGPCANSDHMLLGLIFPGTNGGGASYAIGGSLVGDNTDHVIIFTLKANQDDGKSRQKTFRLHITSANAIGDPHLTTVDGVHYDFQSWGEFVALKGDGSDSLEIQTRQKGVATTAPGSASNNTTGVAACVSLNTAVAARVGTHRVTYQPNIINGQPDPSGLQLRIDGKLTELGDNPIDLGSGGRVAKSSAGPGVIEITFPGGTSLVVTPGWWAAYSVWYINLDIYHTTATRGIMGIIPTLKTTPGIAVSHGPFKSWLPALPDGSTVGPMPTDMHQRFVTLYTTFADAWRVTDATSLFDYDTSTSTATFTNKAWPVEFAQTCNVQGENPKAPIDRATAEQLTIGILDSSMRESAIFDVMITGEPTFAQTYLAGQKVRTSTTATIVQADKDSSKHGEQVTFTATVARKFSKGKDVLSGSVEFTSDGNKLGDVKLDANGRATLTTSTLEVGDHKIAAKFTPDAGSSVFASSSTDVTHTVSGAGGVGGILHQWWFWLIVLILLIIIIAAMRKKKKP